MNQLGQIFKEARMQSGKSIEDAVRETKIAKKYLIAIENEDFDIFPGETYLLGFLRNYAQFLGLDQDEMVVKYRDYKIQEQPAPIEQLTARPRNIRRSFLIVFVVLMIIGAVIYVIVGGKKKGEVAIKEKEQKGKPTEEVSAQKEKRDTVFEEEELTKDFKKGDVIKIPQKNRLHSISIDGLNENLKFSIGTIPFSLSTDEKVEIDFDRDGRKDLLIRINRIGEGVVNLTLKKLYKTELSDSDLIISQKDKGEDVTSEVREGPAAKEGPPEVVIIKESDLLSKVSVAPKTGFQIVSSYEKTDISTQVKVNSTTYFGYIIDEEEKQDALLKSGDELSFIAKDVLRIMVANARGIDLEINKIPIVLGENGQVTAKIVRWYRDSEDSDLYHLIIDDLEK